MTRPLSNSEVVSMTPEQMGKRLLISIEKWTPEQKAAARAELDRQFPIPSQKKKKSPKYAKRILLAVGIVVVILIDWLFLNYWLTRCACIAAGVYALREWFVDAIAEGVRKGRR